MFLAILKIFKHLALLVISHLHVSDLVSIAQKRLHSYFFYIFFFLVFRSQFKMAQDQQQFCLRWNDFQTNMVSSFKHLRDEKSFTDVTLVRDHVVTCGAVWQDFAVQLCTCFFFNFRCPTFHLTFNAWFILLTLHPLVSLVYFI